MSELRDACFAIGRAHADAVRREQTSTTASKERAMAEWQPIETAPMDGTAVWLLTTDGQPVIGYYDPRSAFREGKWFAKASFRRRPRERNLPDDIFGTYAFGFDPTHWMPLPEPK